MAGIPILVAAIAGFFLGFDFLEEIFWEMASMLTIFWIIGLVMSVLFSKRKVSAGFRTVLGSVLVFLIVYSIPIWVGYTS